MRIVEAYQVPGGNASPDIFKLPCVYGAMKDGGVVYNLYNIFAFPTDWICKTEDETWIVLTDEEYKEARK